MNKRRRYKAKARRKAAKSVKWRTIEVDLSKQFSVAMDFAKWSFRMDL